MKEGKDTMGNSTERSPLKGWRKWLRRLVIWVGVFIAFVLMLITIAVQLLSPGRLTPIIEKIASSQLDADVTIGRAELSFWRHFPNLRLDVDSLCVVSHSLDSLPADTRTALPAGADTLLSVTHFHGSLNLFKAVGGEIAIRDVIIDGPAINMLQVNDTTANFNIFPTTPPDDGLKAKIPPVTIDHFAITNARDIRYRSLADSIDVSVRLHTITLDDNGLPLYRLTLDSDIETPMLRAVAFKTLTLNLDSGLRWDAADPYSIDLNNLCLRTDGVDVVVDATADFHDVLRIDRLDVKVNRLDVNTLRRHIPPGLWPQLTSLQTDMTVSVDARLLEPLVFSDALTTPAAEVTVTIPPCRLSWEDITLDRLELRAVADIPRGAPADAVITISRLDARGPGVDASLTGRLADLTGDLAADVRFDGSVDLGRLPQSVDSTFKGTLKGRLTADTRIRMRLSDLTPRTFHRLLLDGTATLDNFAYHSSDTLTGAWLHHASLSMGTNDSAPADAGGTARADSLLIVRIDADTAAVHAPGVRSELSRLHIALGTTNTAASADTTVIRPFGGGFSIASLRYISEQDSTLMSIRDARGLALLRRYRDMDRVPMLNLRLNARRLRAANPAYGAMMENTTVNVAAHFNPRRSDAAADTLGRGRRHGRHALYMTRQQLDSARVEVLDLNIDNSVRSLLRRWQVNGSVVSQSGRVRVRRFPIRQNYEDLALDFSTDSIAIANVGYRMGRTHINVHGSVSNIQGALSRRRPQPLKIDFVVTGDTVNVNELVQAYVSGRRNKHHHKDLRDESNWEEHDLDYIEEKLHYDSIGGPLLVPVNIDAGIKFSSGHVVYSDLLLADVSGEVAMFGGTLSLHNLHAGNEIGDFQMSALYSAPTPGDIELGFGMAMHRFDIRRLTHLVPALDSIVPMMRTLSGTVDARLAATVDVYPDMDLNLPSLRAAFRFEGDSLSMTDNRAMRSVAKWLMFKNKQVTSIDSVNVDIVVRDGLMHVYPFVVNIDRYRLGIMGYNTLGMNLDYHIAVLKSPIPFRFGINIKGTADHPKVRFGGAKFNEGMVIRRDAIADTARVNLVREISRVFRRGVRAARLGPLDIKGDTDATYMDAREETITPADSALLIKAGIIENPDSISQ